MKFRVRIEYDGTDFSGWQIQENADRTVQGAIEAALAQIFQQKIDVIGSGRTDAGVHSVGQIGHFTLPDARMPMERLISALNSMLPKDVQLYDAEPVTDDFHARFSARARSYRYRLERRFHPLTRRTAWTPPHPWDDHVIGQAVPEIVGSHSFKSFCLARPGEEDYFCTVQSCEWLQDQEGATFHITADRFFHKMVRSLVGALYDLGRGHISADDFTRLLHHPTTNAAVYIAPPQGLVLIKVEY